jgi:hypothetical protein
MDLRVARRRIIGSGHGFGGGAGREERGGEERGERNEKGMGGRGFNAD